MGVVFVGQCRIEEEELVSDVAAAARERGGEPSRFVSLYESLPSIKREHLMAMGDLLHLYFSRMGGGDSLFENDGEPAEKRPTAERICAYIEGNYYQELSPHGISERFFLNPSYMARLFRSHAGMSVGEYIRRVRHRHACRLLANKHIPVASIALNVGYRDTNYFCRCFRGIEGMSPGEYRRNLQKTR